MYQVKKEKAITLIALVVTLVILIILAAVSMAMVLGNQGIFKKAGEGANSMHDAEMNTQVAFNSITDEIEQVLQGDNSESEIKEEKPNSPEQIDGMTPIKFTEPTDTEMGSYQETKWDDNTCLLYTSRCV